MVRLVVAMGLAGLVAVTATLLRARLRPTTATSSPARAPLPEHLDRADFPGPDQPWLVALFSSATCATCATVRDRARGLQTDGVMVAEIEHTARPDLHRRYRIDAVPAVAVCDRDGTVHQWLLGSISDEQLRRALGDARQGVRIRRS